MQIILLNVVATFTVKQLLIEATIPLGSYLLQVIYSHCLPNLFRKTCSNLLKIIKVKYYYHVIKMQKRAITNLSRLINFISLTGT